MAGVQRHLRVRSVVAYPVPLFSPRSGGSPLVAVLADGDGQLAVSDLADPHRRRVKRAMPKPMVLAAMMPDRPTTLDRSGSRDFEPST